LLAPLGEHSIVKTLLGSLELSLSLSLLREQQILKIAALSAAVCHAMFGNVGVPVAPVALWRP